MSIPATCSTRKEPILGVYEIENCFGQCTLNCSNELRRGLQMLYPKRSTFGILKFHTCNHPCNGDLFQTGLKVLCMYQ